MMKKLALIALLVCSAGVFSGCAQEDKDEVKDVPGAGSASFGNTTKPNGGAGSGQVQSGAKPESL